MRIAQFKINELMKIRKNGNITVKVCCHLLICYPSQIDLGALADQDQYFIIITEAIKYAKLSIKIHLYTKLKRFFSSYLHF